MLCGHGLDQAAVHHVPDVEREHLLQQRLGIGRQDVVRTHATGLLLGRRDRQDADGGRRRVQHRDEARLHQFDDADAAVGEAIHQVLHQRDGMLRRRAVADVGALAPEGAAEILEEADALLADPDELDLIALGLERVDPTTGFLDQVGIEATRQPAIRRDEDDHRTRRPALRRGLRTPQQRKALRQFRRHQVGNDLAQRLGVRPSRDHAVLGALQLGRGYQLHRPRDLPRVGDGTNPSLERAIGRHFRPARTSG